MLTLADGTVLDLARYPLPDDVPDVLLNRGQIAEAMGVTEPTITAWVKDGMPVATKGGNGQAYEFQTSHCWAWRMHKTAEERAAQDTANQAAAQMRMAFANLDPDQAGAEAGLTPKQIAEMADADYRRSRAAEMRGELVRVDRVRALQEQQMIDFRQALMTLPDFAEQEFGLTPAQAKKLQDRCESALEELSLTLRRLLPETSGGQAMSLDGARQDAFI